jgi:hypothetical protein
MRIPHAHGGMPLWARLICSKDTAVAGVIPLLRRALKAASWRQCAASGPAAEGAVCGAHLQKHVPRRHAVPLAQCGQTGGDGECRTAAPQLQQWPCQCARDCTHQRKRVEAAAVEEAGRRPLCWPCLPATLGAAAAAGGQTPPRARRPRGCSPSGVRRCTST